VALPIWSEQLASAPDTSLAVKRAILAELDHRKTMRAATLRQSLARQLAASQPQAAMPHRPTAKPVAPAPAPTA
jgi:hypothetical protein